MRRAEGHLPCIQPSADYAGRVTKLDGRLVSYLRETDHMSVPELFAVEIKKIGNRAQLEAFVKLCDRSDERETNQIAAVEMWDGRVAVVYKPQPNGVQPIDWIGPRGHIEHEDRPR